MPMQLPANTDSIGEHAYLIRSPDPGMTDCLIIAHGGSVGDQEFTVPTGKTVRFFVPHAHAYSTSSGLAALKDAVSSHGRKGFFTGLTRTEGSSCRDYILGKGLGSHGPSSLVVTYQEIRDELDQMATTPGTGTNWIPHVVTIRNRTNGLVHKHVWLSKLIDEILAVDGRITTFYSCNCRKKSSSPISLRMKAGNRVK